MAWASLEGNEMKKVLNKKLYREYFMVYQNKDGTVLKELQTADKRAQVDDTGDRGHASGRQR